MASRILVINDDQSTLELFQLILEAEGYEVLLSERAMEDVSKIEQQQPHLIILDVKLGTQTDGLLFLQKIRMYPPTTVLPVILCTACGEEGLRREANAAGAFAFITKPLDPDYLAELLKKAILQRRLNLQTMEVEK